jgi:hypothetical protein
VDALFENTRVFLSFQISLETIIAMDAMAFLECLCLWIASFHHSLTLRMACQFVGSTLWRASQTFTLVHTRREKRHLNNRWEEDYWTWLQSLHLPQLGHPFFCSLSAVHTLFWVTKTMRKFCIRVEPKVSKLDEGCKSSFAPRIARYIPTLRSRNYNL